VFVQKDYEGKTSLSHTVNHFSLIRAHMFNYSGNHKTGPLLEQIFTMAPDICGPPLWAFLHVIFLAPINLEVVLRFVENLLNPFISSAERCSDYEFWTSVLSATFIRNAFRSDKYFSC